VPKNSVLIIEDNNDVADTLRRLLTLMGHEVRIARTGPEGVESARTWLPTVIVSDLGLPGLSGFEVAQELRKSPRPGPKPSFWLRPPLCQARRSGHGSADADKTLRVRQAVKLERMRQSVGPCALLSLELGSGDSYPV
jgi:CheY-like chemotaxis protein